MSECKPHQWQSIPGGRVGYDDLQCAKCGYTFYFAESLSELAEKSHRMELSIPCCCCGEPPGNRHRQGCLVLMANKARHCVRPDLFDSDGHAIPLGAGGRCRAMSDGCYWFREAPGAQIHMLRVFKKDGSGRQEVHDLTGHMPRIRGFRYADDLKGDWWKIEEPSDVVACDFK